MQLDAWDGGVRSCGRNFFLEMAWPIFFFGEGLAGFPPAFLPKGSVELLSNFRSGQIFFFYSDFLPEETHGRIFL